MSFVLKSFLSIIFLFSGFQLFASDYVISLKDLQVTSKLNGYYVDKVINVSGEESCIGFVQKGMFNRQEAAFLLPSTATEVESCLKRSFPKSGSTKPMIVRINHLYIYELTWSSKEIACIELSLSFITKDSSGYTDQFLAGDSFEKNGIDVTGFHPKNIVAALGACFDDFSNMAGSGKLNPKQIKEEELLRNPLDHPETFAIFRETHIRKGLFKSFYNFRDCQPDTVTEFSIEYIVPKNDSARLRASLVLPPGLKQKNYFGFSDGKKVYVWTGKRFVPVTREGNAMSSRIARIDIDAGATSDAFMAGYYGGAIVGIVAVVATEVALANDYGKFNINFGTGRMVPANVPDYLRTESNTILFLSPASTSGAEVTILHDQDTLCSLAPGTCLKLSLPSTYRQLKLLLAGKDCISHEETFTLRLFNSDVYLVRIKRNREIVIGPAYEQVRKDILRGMTEENTVVKRDLSDKLPVN